MWLIENNGIFLIIFQRKCDYENYLIALLFPVRSRRSAFAVRACNVEIAQIGDHTGQQTIALMRLQFWKNTIDTIYEDKVPITPLGKELAKAVTDFNLTKAYFDTLLHARECNIQNSTFFDLDHFVDFSEKTISSVYYLILECLGISDCPHCREAAKHLGRAAGIVTLLRSVPYHARHNRLLIPNTLMKKHEVSQVAMQKGCAGEKLQNLIAEICDRGVLELDTAKKDKDSIPKAAIPLFRSSVLIESYLRALQRTDYEVFDQRLQKRNHWLPFKIYAHKLTGRRFS